MFDLKKKCCCSDNQYNFDVPWENLAFKIPYKGFKNML